MHFSVYDGTNHVSVFVFDELDQPVRRTDPNGTTWAGVYDDDRNLLSFNDGNGDASAFANDEFGFPTSVTDGNGDRTTFSYDNRGNLTSLNATVPTESTARALVGLSCRRMVRLRERHRCRLRLA